MRCKVRINLIVSLLLIICFNACGIYASDPLCCETIESYEKLIGNINSIKSTLENSDSKNIQIKHYQIKAINDCINQIKQLHSSDIEISNAITLVSEELQKAKTQILHGELSEAKASIHSIEKNMQNIYSEMHTREAANVINRAPTTPDYFYLDLKKCNACNGQGKLKGILGIEKCSICNGLGQVYVRNDAPPCGRCRGTGKISMGNVTIDWCKGCGGTGWAKVPGVPRPPVGSAITFPPPVEAFKVPKKCGLCQGSGIYRTDLCQICEGDGCVVVNKNSVGCKFCSGKGTMPYSPSKLCEGCKGLGYIERPLPDYWSTPQTNYPVNAKYSYPHELLEEKFCNYCSGRGANPMSGGTKVCPICNGAGSILIRKDCPKCAFCKGQGKVMGKLVGYEYCPGCKGYSYILLPVPQKPYLPQMPPIEILITYKKCAYCSGSGCEPNAKGLGGLPVPCKACSGAGVAVLHKDSPPCRFCNGSGLQNGKRCVNCDGKGWLPLPTPKC